MPRIAFRVIVLAGLTALAACGGGSKEVADRYHEKQALAAAHVPLSTIDLLRLYLSIEGRASVVLDEIEALASVYKFDLSAPLAALRHHNATLRALSPQAQVTFDASFSPRLEYYTGIVFQMQGEGGAELIRLALQLLVAQRREFRLQRVDGGNLGPIALEPPIIGGAEHLLQYRAEHIRPFRPRASPPTPRLSPVARPTRRRSEHVSRPRFDAMRHPDDQAMTTTKARQTTATASFFAPWDRSRLR